MPVIGLAACLLLCLGLPAPAQTPETPPPPAVKEKTLARPDLMLHYKDSGQGEPVLVLMGGPGFSGEGMEPVAQIIAKRGRAIVPDQRGSGGSIPKDPKAITLDATIADLEALAQGVGLGKMDRMGLLLGQHDGFGLCLKIPL